MTMIYLYLDLGEDGGGVPRGGHGGGPGEDGRSLALRP